MTTGDSFVFPSVIERRPEVPPFLTNVFTTNFHPKEMFYVDSLKSVCEAFDHLIPVTSHNGKQRIFFYFSIKTNFHKGYFYNNAVLS